MMANYLMNILSQRPGGAPTGPFGLGMPEEGAMGDYVFGQDAFNQVLSQLMENANDHKPVPATEEIMEKLPREVLEEKCKRMRSYSLKAMSLTRVSVASTVT